MKRVTLPDVVAQMEGAESKRLAYELAVCVCDSDGALSNAEQRFLADASAALRLDAGVSAAFKYEAQAITLLLAGTCPISRLGRRRSMLAACSPWFAVPDRVGRGKTSPAGVRSFHSGSFCSFPQGGATP